HLEFQVVTPRTLQTFKSRVLILPDVKCLSEAEVSILRALVMAGNTLVVTGETGKYDEQRKLRPTNPIYELLSLDGSNRKASSGSPARFLFEPRCPGKAYLKSLLGEFDRLAKEGRYEHTNFDELRTEFPRKLAAVLNFVPQVEVLASPFVASQTAVV